VHDSTVCGKTAPAVPLLIILQGSIGLDAVSSRRVRVECASIEEEALLARYWSRAP